MTALAIALLTLSAGSASSAASAPSKIDRRVQTQLDTRGIASFWVVMRDRADLSAAPAIRDWNARGEYVMRRLQATAARSQSAVRTELNRAHDAYRAFWVANVILVYRATAATVHSLASLADVSRIMPRFRGHIVDGTPGARGTSPSGIEWNIEDIRAPKVWNRLHDRGEGMVVASIDTGTQYNHPALVNQYRGNLGGGVFDHNYNWFQPLHVCRPVAPCDRAGHGTHTMGTMVGDDGGQNQVGVAPGAKWIEAAGCAGACPDSALLASGQWLLAPTNLRGTDPMPSLRPDSINNSWGIPGDDMGTWYQATVDAWIASGIFPAWAAGNEGPGCSSLREPGAYPESYTMGAYNFGHQIAAFSSRGPSPFNGGTTKPDVAAPGVNVRSSVPVSTYQVYSGTSMATPHVAATVALIWSAVPALRGDIATTEKALSGSARAVSDLSCGGTNNFNNVWGHGRLDAYAAVKAAQALAAAMPRG